MSIIKSKEALREAGSVLSAVKEDKEYKSLANKLGDIVAETATFAAVTGISLQMASIIGRYLGKVDDKPIGTVVNSYTRLHGDWDKPGIKPIAITTRNVDFNFELIVRDAHQLQCKSQNPILLPHIMQANRDFDGMVSI